MSAPILAGLRVLDLSCGLAGPVAAQILAEAGADVIKVEPPGGELTRSRHPSAFRTWNRSKRGVLLDLDSPALRSLLASADVLVHSLRPATARRHELDDETLGTRCPRLVVCGAGGWPPGHRDAGRAGYDLLVQAREGRWTCSPAGAPARTRGGSRHRAGARPSLPRPGSWPG
ncbi:CoA transferase [Amycolatopsis acidiphila]|uniref:CoA transferase n=1 Tax=Amycolatopsis acidiphila TaxID=715473 RepID=UPI0019A2403B|nr:CoA transferase [Amycolatopsis acidiphila]UIJ63131.1 CoA transferase [Amycolatopsis acidiphila]GHG73920.1 hypothetical protein GCM10017788_37370 [Amycolatopsis acidiphila]